MTTSEALLIQEAHLKQWAPRLSAQCWAALKEECERRNMTVEDTWNPKDVFRGNDITEFVANWKPSN